MPATLWVHDGMPNPVLHEADFVVHDSLAFHPAHGIFDADADGREPTIHRFCRGREVPSTRCVLELEDRDLSRDEAREALMLSWLSERVHYQP
jgi:hypothetical protein